MHLTPPADVWLPSALQCVKERIANAAALTSPTCATNLQTITCARSDAPMIFEGCGWLSASARIDSKDLMLQVLKFGSPKDGYLCILIWPAKLPLGPRAKTCSLGWVQHPLTGFNCCGSLARPKEVCRCVNFGWLNFASESGLPFHCRFTKRKGL